LRELEPRVLLEGGLDLLPGGGDPGGAAIRPRAQDGQDEREDRRYSDGCRSSAHRSSSFPSPDLPLPQHQGFSTHTPWTSCAVTQTTRSLPRTAPLPFGGPNRATTLSDAGSMTERAVALALTHTRDAATTMSPPVPGTPAEIVATSPFVSGLTRLTVPSPWLSVQTPPA